MVSKRKRARVSGPELGRNTKARERQVLERPRFIAGLRAAALLRVDLVVLLRPVPVSLLPRVVDARCFAVRRFGVPVGMSGLLCAALIRAPASTTTTMRERKISVWVCRVDAAASVEDVRSNRTSPGR